MPRNRGLLSERVQKQRSVFGTSSGGYPFNIGETSTTDETGLYSTFSVKVTSFVEEMTPVRYVGQNSNSPFTPFFFINKLFVKTFRISYRIFHLISWTFHLWTCNRDYSYRRTVTTESNPSYVDFKTSITKKVEDDPTKHTKSLEIVLVIIFSYKCVKMRKNRSNMYQDLYKDDHQARFIAAMLKYRNGTQIDQ